MRRLMAVMIFGILLINLAGAMSQEEIDKAKDIINSKILCDKLSDEQFELLGDYFMEQMHPGELHELMEQRMGGEGSVQLRNIHIAMGKQFYCADSSMMTGGMMNMMMGRNSTGMMNYNYYGEYSSNNWNTANVLINILLIVLIIAVVVWIFKMTKNNKRSK